MKILIKFPTRSRPDKFFDVLNKYVENANDLSNIAFLISCDHDDPTMNNPEVIAKLEKLKEKLKLAYFFGNSKTKIQAVNADVNKINGWDVLLLASDDMVPVIKGYDDQIRKDMYSYFMNTDGTLWYNDGGQDKINTLSILGRKYYDRFGYIYHPSYISLWCDNEFTEVSIKLGRCQKIDKKIIEHFHPVYNKTDYDQLYIKNESYFGLDQQNYMKRAKKDFDLYDQFPLFSILTPSVYSRMDNDLKKIINKIEKQIKENNLEGKVEHLIMIDNKISTIGRKRDSLVQTSNGKFVAFVDDDDDISDDYVIEIYNTIKNNPNVDVITFKQNCYVDDNPVSTVLFGLKNEHEPYIPNSTFNRKPYHICVWNSKLAKKYHFSSINYGEDLSWVTQLWQDAKNEFFIDKNLHSYVYRTSHSEANAANFRNKQI